MLEFNIAPNTQVGRIIIDYQVYEHENAYNVEAEKYSRGGEFVENLVTDNIIEFSKRWLHLAGFKEMIDDINEYFKSVFPEVSFREVYYSKSAILPTTTNEYEELEFNNIKAAIIFNDKYVRPENMNYKLLTEKGVN